MATQSGGVQSVSRALDILEILADAGGEMAISEIASATDLPLPTIHRLLRTLVARGYAYQTPRRRYALGARLIPLGELAGGAVGEYARPVLADLVSTVGESASLAMRDLDRAVYVAHVPSTHSMRMFTEVGRRVDMHSTGVGKVLLALAGDDDARTVAARVGLEGRTVHTITTVDALLVELAVIRRRGFALDAEEQELGVTCMAVPVNGPVKMAMSVSGPTSRMGAARLKELRPILTAAADRLATQMSEGDPSATTPREPRR